MNVNRWRGQIGLASIEPAALGRLATPLDPADPGAILVDMTGEDPRTKSRTRMVAAIVPKGAYTWFYKMMGDDPVIEREKEGFIGFVQSVKYGGHP